MFIDTQPYIFLFSAMLLGGLCACSPEVEQNVELSGQVHLADQDGVALDDGSHGGITVHLNLGGGELKGTTETDPQGRFVFAGVSQVDYTLTFLKEGFQPLTEIPAHFRDGRHVIFNGESPTMHPDTSARLTVQLQSTEPPDNWSEAVRRLELVGSGQSQMDIDAQGTIALKEPVAPGLYQLIVEVAGHLPHNGLLQLASGLNEPPDIVLVPESGSGEAVVLSGQVDTGTPDNSGIQVSVRLDSGTLFSTTLTDSTGAFALQTGRREHFLSFSKPGFQRPEGDPEQIQIVWVEDAAEEDGGFFSVDGQKLEDIVWRLEPKPTASLTGQLDSPIDFDAWLDLTLITLVGDDIQRIDTPTPDGSFQFVGLPPGIHTLTILAQGHQFYSEEVALEVGVNELDTITLTPDGEDDGQAVALTGIARLEGQPEEAHANIIIRAIIGNQAVDNAVTDPNGNFSIRTSRLNHTLEVSHPAYLTRTVQIAWDEADDRFEINDLGLDDEEAQIVLSPNLSASIEGRLTSPIEGIDWPSVARVSLVGPVRRLLAVNPEGEFEQGNLPPGEYVLEVGVDGHSSVVQEVSLGEGVTILEVIALDPLEVLLTTQVALQDGGNPENIIVRARLNDRLVATTLTDSDGQFVLAVSPQTHELSFSKQFYVGTEVIVVWVEDHFEKDRERLDGLQDPLVTLVREPLSDQDFDGVPDGVDNCPSIVNPSQDDADRDSLGDACDNCPDHPNHDQQTDQDEDSIGDTCDNCPEQENYDQGDRDLDGRGDVCDIRQGDIISLSPASLVAVTGLTGGGFAVASGNLANQNGLKLRLYDPNNQLTSGPTNITESVLFGDGPYNVEAATFSPDRLVVLWCNQSNTRVRLFSQNGQAITPEITINQPSIPTNCKMVLAGDTIVIYHSRHLHFYSNNGEFLHSEVLPSRDEKELTTTKGFHDSYILHKLDRGWLELHFHNESGEVIDTHILDIGIGELRAGPVVSLLSNEEYLVVWSMANSCDGIFNGNGNSCVFSRHVSSDGVLLGENQFIAGYDNYRTTNVFTVPLQGRHVIGWRRRHLNNEASSDTIINILNNEGDVLTGDFVVNLGGGSYADTPTAAVLEPDYFVVAWSEGRQTLSANVQQF